MKRTGLWSAVLLLALSSAPGCGGKSATAPRTPVLGPPILASINGATSPSGNTGSTVALEGANFGSAQGTAQVLFDNGSGVPVPAVIASSADWTNSFIVTTVPAGAGSGPVRVVTSAGTSDSLTFTITQNSTFSPSAISWNSTTPLPVGLSGHAAAFASLRSGSTTTNVVYITGGADSTDTPRSDVLYATVQTGGALGAWTSTASLPSPLAFHAAVVATPANARTKRTGFLYALGGATDAAGLPTSAVYRGTLNPDGSIAAWSAATSLPVSTHSLGAAIFHGDLYVAGGATAGNTPSALVYRARIDSTGALGAWQQLTSLPAGRSYHGFAAFAGYLYCLGGETGADTPNDSTYTTGVTLVSDIVLARINLRTGALAIPWSPNGTSLTKAVAKHTSIVAGGNVLITAGLYNGAKTGSTEESYAQINPDGSIGSFNGATGSQTISSAGGGDLFNHAALTYLDPLGVEHVMVLGGDDVNSPGKKRAGVWYY
jgi:IPT/TIG domain-containing protein